MATQDQYQMASLVDLEAREEASMSEIEHTIYTTQLALQEYTQWDRRYSSSVRMSESMYCTPANAHPFSPMTTTQHAVTAFFVLQHIRNAEQTTVMHRCNPRSPFPTTIRIIVPRSPPTAHHLPPSPTITHHHSHCHHLPPLPAFPLPLSLPPPGSPVRSEELRQLEARLDMLSNLRAQHAVNLRRVRAEKDRLVRSIRDRLPSHHGGGHNRGVHPSPYDDGDLYRADYVGTTALPPHGGRGGRGGQRLPEYRGDHLYARRSMYGSPGGYEYESEFGYEGGGAGVDGYGLNGLGAHRAHRGGTAYGAVYARQETMRRVRREVDHCRGQYQILAGILRHDAAAAETDAAESLVRAAKVSRAAHEALLGADERLCRRQQRMAEDEWQHAGRIADAHAWREHGTCTRWKEDVMGGKGYL